MENWLTKRARLTPNRVAVTYQDKELTFLEVNQQALRVAGKIAAIGDKNDKIAVIMTNNLSGYLVIMALQQLGQTIVFINRRLSVDEVNYQLQDAGVTLLLTDDAYDGVLAVNRQLKFSSLPEGEKIQPMAEFSTLR